MSQCTCFSPMLLFWPCFCAHAVFWLCMRVFAFYFESNYVFLLRVVAFRGCWSCCCCSNVCDVSNSTSRWLPWHQHAQALGGNGNGMTLKAVCAHVIEISKSAKSANQANRQICKISKWCTHEQNQQISKLAKFNAAALPMAPLAWNWPGLRWGWGRKRSA